MIIGLTGPKYAGKTEVVKILTSQYLRFTSYGFGDEVRLEVSARGLPPTTSLHDFAVARIWEFGPKYWSTRVAGRITGEPERRLYVVDGMRTLADLEKFREFPDFTLVGITAGLGIRWNRCQDRKRHDDPKTYAEFVQMCEKDESSGPEGLQSRNLFQMADFTLVNDGNLLDLGRKVMGLLDDLKK